MLSIDLAAVMMSNEHCMPEVSGFIVSPHASPENIGNSSV
jgi:hypothetical protein